MFFQERKKQKKEITLSRTIIIIVLCFVQKRIVVQCKVDRRDKDEKESID